MSDELNHLGVPLSIAPEPIGEPEPEPKADPGKHRVCACCGHSFNSVAYLERIKDRGELAQLEVRCPECNGDKFL